MKGIEKPCYNENCISNEVSFDLPLHMNNFQNRPLNPQKRQLEVSHGVENKVFEFVMDVVNGLRTPYGYYRSRMGGLSQPVY